MEDDFDFDNFIDYEGQANLPQPDQIDLSQTSAEPLSNNALDCTLDDFDPQSTMLFDTNQSSTAQSSIGERVVASQDFSLMDSASGGLQEVSASQESLSYPSIDSQPMNDPLFALHGAGGHGCITHDAPATPPDIHNARYTCQIESSGKACGKTFGRLDSLRRHQLLHTGSETNFACPYCLKYQGTGAFLRKDKLNQHLRQFHRIGGDDFRARDIACLHADCQDGGADAFESTRFSSNAELHKHMRKVHKAIPFECPVEDCNRIGAKGWFRAHDREVHQRKEHSNLDIVNLGQMNAGIDARRPAFLST